MGIPEYEAKRYEGKIKDGNILISVHVNDYDELDRVEEILKDSGAEDIRGSAESAVSDDRPELEAVGEIRPYTRDSATLNADRNNTSADDYGVKAGREYERAVRDFEATGQAEAKAQEAKAAIEGPEREELRRAEQIGKGRAKTKTAHDNE